ncbi:MAG: hypothetical protein IH964_05625 [Candidatus Dadabacteria bacterium]|nr:hypothetical protein [Candidatus Dadabacteria bacterium]
MEEVGKKLKPVDASTLPSQIEQPRALVIIDSLTPDIVQRRLKKQAEVRNTFLKHVRQSMKKGVHYMPAPKKGALSYLKQEGALLLKDFFECEVDYEITREVHENDFYAITIKCFLRHPSGKVFIGLGWANSGEYNFTSAVEAQAKKVINGGNSDLSADNVRKAFYHTQTETVAQMSRKRALVNAARHLPFVSELFTTESENEEGIAENSEQALKTKHHKRLSKLMAWLKSEYNLTNDNEIKEKLTTIVGKTITSKRNLVKNDILWDKFAIHVNEVVESRNYEKE